MAKKKPKPDAPKSKRRAPSPPPGLPSRRAMEGVLRQLAADLQGTPTPVTPLDQAQTLIDAAFDEPNPQRRLEPAQERRVDGASKPNRGAQVADVLPRCRRVARFRLAADVE